MQGPKRRSYGVAVEPEATGGGSARVLSRKELARELRKAAYQRAKQARAADPRHQAMKEAAKQRRREMYQQVKERRKAREAELEAKAKASAAAEREAMQQQLAQRVRGAIQGRSTLSRAAQSGAVQSGAVQSGAVQSGAVQSGAVQSGAVQNGAMPGGPVQGRAARRSILKTAGEPASADTAERTLARDIERALQCSDVRDLLDRLRRESPSLATHHGDTPQLGSAPHLGDNGAES